MRIMTTNIWGDYFNNPVSSREEDIFCIYKNYAPDIIGFQEVTSRWYNSNLFKWLSDEYFFIGTEIFNSNNYVPIAVKKSLNILAKGAESFADTPDASKGISWAVVSDKDNNIFGICNVHFWWKQGEEIHDIIRAKNAQQLCNIMKYIYDRFKCPVFSFGDMNCTKTSPVFKVIYPINGIQHLYELADNKDDICSIHGDPIADNNGKYHGEKTVLDQSYSIDHIVALGTRFNVAQYKTVVNQYALDATDHSPVFADINFN